MIMIIIIIRPLSNCVLLLGIMYHGIGHYGIVRINIIPGANYLHTNMEDMHYCNNSEHPHWFITTKISHLSIALLTEPVDPSENCSIVETIYSLQCELAG